MLLLDCEVEEHALPKADVLMSLFLMSMVLNAPSQQAQALEWVAHAGVGFSISNTTWTWIAVCDFTAGRCPSVCVRQPTSMKYWHANKCTHHILYLCSSGNVLLQIAGASHSYAKTSSCPNLMRL